MIPLFESLSQPCLKFVKSAVDGRSLKQSVKKTGERGDCVWGQPRTVSLQSFSDREGSTSCSLAAVGLTPKNHWATSLQARRTCDGSSQQCWQFESSSISSVCARPRQAMQWLWLSSNSIGPMQIPKIKDILKKLAWSTKFARREFQKRILHNVEWSSKVNCVVSGSCKMCL